MSAVRPPRARIFYLEDHELFARGIIASVLVDFEVVWTTTFEEARSIWCNDEDFDLVLCDYDLPHSKGVDFVRWLRARGVEAAIVAVSAHDHGNAELLAAGADAACAKTQFATLPALILTLTGGSS